MNKESARGSLRARLDELKITCHCGAEHHVTNKTPREIWDPELNRFARPQCLEVTMIMLTLTPAEDRMP